MNILLIFLAIISNIAAISTGAFLLSVIPGMNIFTYSLAYAADIAILAAISFTTQRLLRKIFLRTDAGPGIFEGNVQPQPTKGNKK